MVIFRNPLTHCNDNRKETKHFWYLMGDKICIFSLNRIDGQKTVKVNINNNITELFQLTVSFSELHHKVIRVYNILVFSLPQVLLALFNVIL